MRARRLAAHALVLCLGSASVSQATDCTRDTGQSTCFDSDALWLRPGPARFIAVPPVLEEARGSLDLVVSMIGKPVQAHARSPDPNGRDVPVVKTRLTASCLGSYSPVRGLQLDAALPVIAYQAGAGLNGVTAQDGASLASPVFGDLRLGAQYALWHPARTSRAQFAVAGRLDVVLPTGNEGHFAGERGAVAAPTVILDLDLGRLFLASDIGVRLRQSVEFGGVKLGHQLATGLGVGARFLDDRLNPALEVHIATSLSNAERALPGGGSISTVNAPADWLLSLTARPWAKWPVALRLGGGGAIALSSERLTRTGGETTTVSVAGLPSPAWRALLALRGTWE